MPKGLFATEYRRHAGAAGLTGIPRGPGSAPRDGDTGRPAGTLTRRPLRERSFPSTAHRWVASSFDHRLCPRNRLSAPAFLLESVVGGEGRPPLLLRPAPQRLYEVRGRAVRPIRSGMPCGRTRRGYGAEHFSFERRTMCDRAWSARTDGPVAGACGSVFIRSCIKGGASPARASGLGRSMAGVR